MSAHIVTISPGVTGWPGEAADYWHAGRGSEAQRRGYSLVDVAMDAIHRHAYRVRRFAHHALTCADVEAIHAEVGTWLDGATLPGMLSAEHFALGALLTAWRQGYTVRSVYRGEDYPPPGDAVSA